MAGETATEAGSMYPTGMHSCLFYVFGGTLANIRLGSHWNPASSPDHLLKSCHSIVR